MPLEVTGVICPEEAEVQGAVEVDHLPPHSIQPISLLAVEAVDTPRLLPDRRGRREVTEALA